MSNRGRRRRCAVPFLGSLFMRPDPSPVISPEVDYREGILIDCRRKPASFQAPGTIPTVVWKNDLSKEEMGKILLAEYDVATDYLRGEGRSS